MGESIVVMKAVPDPSRVKILKMLQHKSMCVCEMQTALKPAQPTVSKHLKILEDSGLVACRKSGLWVNYYLTDEGTTPYAASLLGNLKHWLDNDPEIIRLAETIPSIRREDLRKWYSSYGRLPLSPERT